MIHLVTYSADSTRVLQWFRDYGLTLMSAVYFLGMQYLQKPPATTINCNDNAFEPAGKVKQTAVLDGMIRY